MGQVLFWLEAAIASVLFVALGVGIVSRTRRSLRRLLGLAWGLLAIAPWLAAIGAFAAVENFAGGAKFPLVCASVAGGVWLVAAIVVIRRGRRPSALAHGQIASTWRLNWLVLALGAMILLAIGAFAAVEFAGGAWFPLVCASIAGGACLAAAIIVIRRGRISTVVNGQIAATWRLNRLALALGAVILLACMTFWNLDLAVRQEMAAMRVEAGAVALSISPPRIPDSQNAALLYIQALEILDAQAEPEEMAWDKAVTNWLNPHPIDGTFKPDDQEMLAFMARQASVIELIRKAAELPGCNFGTEYNPPSRDVRLPPLHKVRRLGQLLCLSSRVAAHQGRMTEAMNDLNAVLALAKHCTSDPSTIASIVSFGSEEQAFETFQYVLGQGAPTAESLNAIHLDPTLSFNAALHRSMRLETAFGISMFTMPHPSALFAVTSMGLPWYIEVLDYASGPYRVFLLDCDMAAYLRWMHRSEQLSAQPYHESLQEWQKTPWSERREVGGLLTSYFAPAFSRAAEMAAKADAWHRLLGVAVAMWRYRLAEGAFPGDLGQLVPRYMLTVPVDPFTGKALSIIQTDDGQTVIYSVGPDLVDDGGKPDDGGKTMTKQRSQQTRHYYWKEPTGDISLTLSK